MMMMMIFKRVHDSLSCTVHVHVYTRASPMDPREEKRACRTSRRTSRRGLSCVSGSWHAEWGSRRTRRLPRAPRHACAKVGEDVRVGVVVGVGVGPMEFQLIALHRQRIRGRREC